MSWLWIFLVSLFTVLSVFSFFNNIETMRFAYFSVLLRDKLRRLNLKALQIFLATSNSLAFGFIGKLHGFLQFSVLGLEKGDLDFEFLVDVFLSGEFICELHLRLRASLFHQLQCVAHFSHLTSLLLDFFLEVICAVRITSVWHVVILRISL